MVKHDPIKFVSQLSGKLAARSRHVSFFFGAGTARACGLPDIAGLQTKILDRLKGQEHDTLEAQLKGRTLEGVLSRLRRIHSLLTGSDKIDGITADFAHALDVSICNAIVKELDVKSANLDPVKCFAAWAARARYRSPLEIFTVNYDLLLETALEAFPVPYFDGFMGALRARFIIDLVEGDNPQTGEVMPGYFVRLWKLHGSVNWAREDKEVVRLGNAIQEQEVAAIYPSDEKYEESRRVPFVVLQDRFRRSLSQPESLVVITGYSFSDDHLNEMIFDAASRRERSEFIAFSFSDIPDALRRRALTTPNLQAIGRKSAIIAGIEGEWQMPEDGDNRFWENDSLTLPDFAALARFLASSSSVATSEPSALEEALASAAKSAVKEITDAAKK